MSSTKGLGKGLGALLSVFEDEDENENLVETVTSVKPQKKVTKNIGVIQKNEHDNIYNNEEGKVLELSLDKIYANPNQPRKNFDENALMELADSIKIHGVIQPIVVNKTDNGYMIIAGERRYRASKLAGKSTIPAIVKDYTNKQIVEISIIENLQREDLNPIEAARAIKQLMEEYNFNQETVADRIGKSRSQIANTLRLLNLYPDVIKMVEEGELSQGHAKCLVVIDDVNIQLKFANQAKNNRITVRELERMVKDYLNPKQKKVVVQSIELKELVNNMSKIFSTKVSVLGNDNKGRIYIDYYNRDDLDRISELLGLIEKKTLTLKDLENFNKHK